MRSRRRIVGLGMAAVVLLLLLLGGSLLRRACRDLDFSPIEASIGHEPDGLGPPRSLVGLVGASDVIVQAEVASVEARDGAIGDPHTRTRLRVDQSFLGPFKTGDTLTVDEGAAPPAASVLGLAACNGPAGRSRLREASRAGDRRLWFLSGRDLEAAYVVPYGPYGRLDLDSGEVLITSPRPLTLGAAGLVAPAGPAEFLEALQFAVAERGR